jgi:deoxycytidine triphosphate deaminase
MPRILTYEDIKRLGLLQPSKTGVLTYSEIKDLGIIHTNFNEAYLAPASYDLTLGNEYILPSSVYENNKGINRIKKLFGIDQKLPIEECDSNNGILKIPKFSSVVFTTAEVLRIPNDVVGRFDLKIRYALMGLVLQVGTQIEPNYKGVLFGRLLNFSGEDIIIKKGDPFLTIEFSYLSSLKIIPHEELEQNIKNYDRLEPIANRYKRIIRRGTLEAFFNEIQNVYKRNEISLGKNRRTVNNTIAIIAIVISIFLGFIIYDLTKLTYDRDDHEFYHPNTNIVNLRDGVQALDKTVEELDIDMNEANQDIQSINQSVEDMRLIIKSISVEVDSLKNVISEMENNKSTVPIR